MGPFASPRPPTRALCIVPCVGVAKILENSPQMLHLISCVASGCKSGPGVCQLRRGDAISGEVLVAEVCLLLQPLECLQHLTVTAARDEDQAWHEAGTENVTTDDLPISFQMAWGEGR